MILKEKTFNRTSNYICVLLWLLVSSCQSKSSISLVEPWDNGKICIAAHRGGYENEYEDEAPENSIANVINAINKNFPKAWKTPDMELYKYARGPAKNLTVLSYANEKATNINWPVEWIISYGKGRVYNSSMGHLWTGETYPLSYQCIGFQTTLIRATEWLATGKTSYPLPKRFPLSSEVSLRKTPLSKL